MKFIDPRTDFAFKKIFGNDNAHDVLIHFLNSLLGLKGEHTIVRVTILNPYQAPKVLYQKHSFLDVKCIDQRGTNFLVEMQVQYIKAFEKRIIYNASKAYANQLGVGENYPQLNQVIAINILDFILFDDLLEYHTKHIIKEDISNNCYLDEIQYHFIELPKFYIEESDLVDMSDKWIYFIKETGNLDHIPGSLDIEPYRHAFEIANRADMSREEMEAFESASIVIQDEKGAVEAALDKGRLEGKAEGKIEGEKSLIIKQIERKWGRMQPEIKEKLDKIKSAEELESLGEKVIVCNNLEDLFTNE